MSTRATSWSRPKHTFKLPHLHDLRPGSLICVKGLSHVTGASFILVFIFSVALSFTTERSNCLTTGTCISIS